MREKREKEFWRERKAKRKQKKTGKKRVEEILGKPETKEKQPDKRGKLAKDGEGYLVKRI